MPLAIQVASGETVAPCAPGVVMTNEAAARAATANVEIEPFLMVFGGTPSRAPVARYRRGAGDDKTALGRRAVAGRFRARRPRSLSSA